MVWTSFMERMRANAGRLYNEEMTISSVFLTVIVALSSAPTDSNLVSNSGFETGITGWSFWARSTDSGTQSAAVSGCRQGSGCLQVAHLGAQDWASWPVLGKFAVRPGEVWRWQVWTKFDSSVGHGTLGFVTRDSSGATMSWNAAATDFDATDTGWRKITARISVPKGCAQLQPRLTGYGIARLLVDDAEVAKEADATGPTGPLVLVNDSVKLEIDGTDLSMRLIDADGRDTLKIGDLAAFRLDSAKTTSDTIFLGVRNLASMWRATLRAHLSGGSLRLAYLADSATVVPTEFLFPGIIATRPGQKIALPRGTGLAWPVDRPVTNNWSYRSVPFWEWQVSQALTGATDGSTGFVVSVDQPSNARMYVETFSNTTPTPKIWQTPAKGVFGHTRSVAIAPLRGGGWGELARRHRSRREELGRVKNWQRKALENPDVEKLRGAMDWWVFGGFTYKSFDSLRWMGMEKGLLHTYTSKSAEIDSMVSHGWLLSVYDNWADAFPGDTMPNGKEYSAGAVVKEDGSYMLGWLEKHTDGSTRQALEICSSRHDHLARANLALDRVKFNRNARFIDVELAVQPLECWSTVHPVDRRLDLDNRVRALSVIKDSFRLVTGSEQTRDIAHAVVDYGEGPMSIASVADAGYDWSTPEPPEGRMDSMSMDPTFRVPLLLLADHDAFAPTWYTGDGQSKVPARWDAKDTWNMLYATMPLIAPKDRRMWDTLRSRYMRTILAVGSFLARTHFETMTEFVTLSDDAKVQKTVFGNGWNVAANFDSRERGESGTPLPPNGFLAKGAEGFVERRKLDGVVRTRVRLDDRWFLDPEGSEATMDGIRTSGQVFLKRLGDTTLALSIVGDQEHVDIAPASLPWPAKSVRAVRRSGGQATDLVDAGSGWSRLRTSVDRFYLIHGDFGAFQDTQVAKRAGVWARISRRTMGWELSWTQDRGSNASVSIVAADGKSIYRTTIPVGTGIQRLSLPGVPRRSWVRIESEAGERILSIPGI
jgi:hypothetical protein